MKLCCGGARFGGGCGEEGGTAQGAFHCPPPPAPCASCVPQLRLCPAEPEPGAFLGKNVKEAEFGQTWPTAALPGGPAGSHGGRESPQGGTKAPRVPLGADVGDGPRAEPGGWDAG